MAKFILNLHQNTESEKGEIDNQLLKKYVVYARQNIFPRLTDSAIDEIKDYYVKMRNSGSDEGGIKSIPITARQLEALVRLAEASARVRLSDKVTKSDARRAISLLNHCLSQVGVDPETGKIDIDRISTGVTATERSKIVGVREIISELEAKGGKTIKVEDIYNLAAEKGLDEGKVDAAIEKLKRTGDIFEPKSGVIQRI
jgi:replicative DNA helicase Mcm